MPTTHHDKVLNAEDMMQRGEYTKALELVSTVLASEDITDELDFQARLIMNKARIKLGKMEETEESVLELLDDSDNQDNLWNQSDLLLLKLEIMWKQGQIDEGFVIVGKLEDILVGLKNDLSNETDDRYHRIQGDLYRQKGILYWYKGEFGAASECHQLSLESCKDRNDERGIAVSLNNLGLVYWSIGNLDEASNYYEQAMQIQNKLGNQYEVATILNNLGNVYMLRGEIEKGYEYHQKCLKVREELGNKRDLALTLTNLGAVYQTLGDFNQALDCLHQSLEYYQDTVDYTGMSLTFNNLGSIHQIRGELDIALEYHKKSLEIRQKQNAKHEIALSLLNMGELERRKGNVGKADEFYKQSLSIYEEVGNDTYTAIALSYLINFSLENNQRELALQYLSRLKELNESCIIPLINQRYKLENALVLKSSKLTRDKLQAQEVLNEIVNEESTSHDLTVNAMIHLCDLLLFELKVSDDENLLTRINELTTKLLEIGRDQGSFTLQIESNILQSKLALIEGDLDKARIHLAQAHITAQEKGLHLLARKVSHERDILQSQLDKWENIIKKNPPKQQMADLANLDEFLERMIRKTVSVLSNDEKKYLDDEAVRRKYTLEYLDLMKNTQKSEKRNFRIGIAQMGLSDTGDILNEFYEELGTGLLGIKIEKVNIVREKIHTLIDRAHEESIKVLLFPEMTIDLNYPELLEEIISLAKKYEMYIIPGSFHISKTKQNICRVISPEGIIWEQAKHIPAIIHLLDERFTEGIDVSSHPRKIMVCNTEYGRIAIAICRDFLDMDLRVELKNFDPPIDLVLNPAFTPVTADFKAAHFDARRSIYAYCCFANVAEYGDSIIHAPEKDRMENIISRGEEGIIFKDVDLFQLRSERKKWESIQKKQRSFIQSTKI